MSERRQETTRQALARNRALRAGTPILIPCEGSSAPGHEMINGFVMCPMCGRVLVGHHAEGYGLVVGPHERDDVLARIDRGDFNP